MQRDQCDNFGCHRNCGSVKQRCGLERMDALALCALGPASQETQMKSQALRASVRKDQEKAVADCAFFFTCRSVDRSYRYLTSGPVTIKTLRRLKKTGPQTRKKLRGSKNN